MGVSFGDYVPRIREKREEKVAELKYLNGHFYNIDGTFSGKVEDKINTGSVNDVYACTGKSKKKDKDVKEIKY
jgi:hypothetical protein